MNEDEWMRVLAAYRSGLAADMMQLQGTDGEWGVIWTVPPCSPAALAQASRQAVQCRSTHVRHVRRGRLTLHGRETVDVVIVTEAPPITQVVRSLHSARILVVNEMLADDALQMLLVTVVERGARKSWDTVNNKGAEPG